ncbi:MAG TPA: hypothetical protein V6D34_06445 [Candidatus Sericytochromatia bacterium]
MAVSVFQYALLDIVFEDTVWASGTLLTDLGSDAVYTEYPAFQLNYL